MSVMDELGVLTQRLLRQDCVVNKAAGTKVDVSQIQSGESEASSKHCDRGAQSVRLNSYE